MKPGLTKKENRILSITIACCGLLMIGSGLTMTASGERTTIKKTYSLDITEAKVAQAQTNEIKLKDMELEINNPLSLNVKDYLENADEIEPSVLKALKLDTSLININQAGTYNYTITYKKKKYNGIFVIKAKELPKVEIKLRNLSLKVGSSLSPHVASYIVGEVDEEVINNCILNTQGVNTFQPDEYQYTVTYNNRIYTGKIFVYNYDNWDKDETNKDNNNNNNTTTETQSQSS